MTPYEPRRRRARERVPSGAGALLVTAPANVRYLTGFTGSNGQLLLDDDPVFFTDGRYTEQASAQVPGLRRIVYSTGMKLGDVLGKVVAERGLQTLAVEASHLTLAAVDRLRAAVDGIEFAPSTDVVEGVRRCKSPDEVDAIRRSQRITEVSLVETLAAFEEGTEVDLAMALEWSIRRRGAEAVSFDVIVAGGDHSALPHAEPRPLKLDRGGAVLVDLGARADGYCSDMTRTYLGQKAPDPLPAAHAAVRAALEAACDAVRPGVKAADVDRAARERLEADGFGDAFVHSTGHGVGLEVHEGPSLNSTSEDVLEPGMVVTVEPGVYLPGVGGVRVEDLLVVTDAGAEILTTLDRGPEWPS